MTSGTDVGAGEEPTRVDRQSKSNTEPHPESVVITAEIPLASASRARRIGAPSGPSLPERERRDSAPVALQLFVWFLFVLFVVGLAGLAVEHFHPSWVGFMRNAPAKSTARGHAGASNGSNGNSKSGFALTASSATGATYSVPTASSYELLVAAQNACYVEVKVPPKSSHFVYAHTITQSTSPATIRVTGASSLYLAARATSLVVEVNSSRVGTISPPKPFFTYTFIPSST